MNDVTKDTIVPEKEPSLMEQVKKNEEKLEKIEESLQGKKKKEKVLKIKIPGKIARAAEKSTEKAAALVVGTNRRAQWKLATYRDGLWYIGDGKDASTYAYEETAIFYFKKTPVIIVMEWRLLPVGGQAEEVRSWIVGGVTDIDIADLAGIKKFGQQTIIRNIEQAEVDKDKKKAGGMGWIIWALVGVGILYMLSKFFGGG